MLTCSLLQLSRLVRQLGLKVFSVLFFLAVEEQRSCVLRVVAVTVVGRLDFAFPNMECLQKYSLSIYLSLHSLWTRTVRFLHVDY